MESLEGKNHTPLEVVFMESQSQFLIPTQLVESIYYQEGSITSKVILKSKHGTATLFAFDQGQELHEHTADFDALLTIIDGEARVYLDGQKYGLTQGDIMVLPANIPHALRANKRFKMVLTIIKN